MKPYCFKRILFQGIALAIPVVVIIYVVHRVLKAFEKLIAPLAKKLGIETLFGELTITIIAVFCMLLIVFLLGLLMQISFVAQFRRSTESWILKFIPSLNTLKVIAAEKLEMENASNLWKPVLLENEETYEPAYVIEETREWITLVLVKFPTTDPGNLLIKKRNSVRLKEITMQQMKLYNKQFGKGYISLLEQQPVK